jgi:hypothetical protein
MADRRITELSAVSAINVEVDLLPIVSGGTTKKITAKSFAENIEFLSYQGSDLKALSANWQNTYTTVNQTSGKWESVYATVEQTSGNWESTYTTVKETSSTWQDTHTTVATNSAIWGAVEFNNNITYVDVMSGLNEMLRLNIGGHTRYIRLFDIGPELFLFGTEDTIDNIITEDGNDQLLFVPGPELFVMGTEDELDILVDETEQYKIVIT